MSYRVFEFVQVNDITVEPGRRRRTLPLVRPAPARHGTARHGSRWKGVRGIDPLDASRGGGHFPICNLRDAAPSARLLVLLTHRERGREGGGRQRDRDGRRGRDGGVPVAERPSPRT